MYKTIFMGTAPFGFPVMRELDEDERIDLLGVISQPDRESGRGQETQSPPVAEYARELDLPLFQPEDVNDDGLGVLRDLGEIDIAFLVAYGQFLDDEVYDYPKHGTYNFHASLLPRWRGAAPIRHTLLNGDDQTGVSIFRLQEGMDTGPVCKQVRTEVGESETYGELYERLSELNVGALNLFLEELERGVLDCRPQERDATYAPMIENEDARIDWTDSAVDIERHVRAFSPEPGAFSKIDDERLKIYRVVVEDEVNDGAEPGQILECSTKSLMVKAGTGGLSIRELQPAGSRRMDVEDFLAGQPEIVPGDRFDVPAETIE